MSIVARRTVEPMVVGSVPSCSEAYYSCLQYLPSYSRAQLLRYPYMVHLVHIIVFFCFGRTQSWFHSEDVLQPSWYRPAPSVRNPYVVSPS